MPVRRRQSIDALYDQVADHDLVLTTDAPLSLALNRRLDQPHLGRFAATPRMLASGAFRPRDDRDLFLELIDRTGYAWKTCAYLVDHALSAWDHTGSVRGILAYDRFDTPAMREAIQVFEDVESAHRALDTYEIDADRDVAVIGPDQFTTLDRSVLPPTYDEVDPFVDAAVELPAFHVFDSRTAIVDAVRENVDATRAEDVAVVMDRDSDYPTLVEGAFEAADIPYYGGPRFRDDEGLRAFLALVRVAFADDAAHLEDLRPVLSYLGIDVDAGHDKKRLHALQDPAIDRLQQFCTQVTEHSFDAALQTFEGWAAESLAAVREELATLGLLDARVTEERVADLGFYLVTYDVPIDRDDSGVLLADATAAAYVDRPVVFYLGMDAAWTQDIPEYPWLDREAADAQALAQFQLLLQNGQSQYYLVEATRMGEPVTPCLYFHDLLDADIDSFTDLESVDHAGTAPTHRGGFEHDPIECWERPIDMLSQSDLKTFVNSPRDYYFDKLLDGPDRDYFRRGTLYHDYAEFAVANPDVVADTPREAFVDVMVEEMRAFVDDVDEPLWHTQFQHGLAIIDEFLDTHPPTVRDYEGYESAAWTENVFAAAFDVTVDSPIAERWFEDPGLGGRGLVDLINQPTELIDYKSGSKTTATQVVARSATDEISDTPEFQALLYLAHHRRVVPDCELDFVFFHFRDLVDDAVTGDYDLEDAIVRITYYPEPFADHATREAAFEAVIGDVAQGNNRRKTLEAMGYDVYRSFLVEHPFPEVRDREELQNSAFAAAFREYAIDHVGDYKYVRKGAANALNRLLDIRARNYYAPEVEAFETFLDAQIDRVNEYRETRFPIGDPNHDRVDHGDLLIDD
ncbi:MAG: PD-(D/E)XK nuclease family protein [Halobacteriaceae archaeon]